MRALGKASSHPCCPTVAASVGRVSGLVYFEFRFRIGPSIYGGFLLVSITASFSATSHRLRVVGSIFIFLFYIEPKAHVTSSDTRPYGATAAYTAHLKPLFSTIDEEA